MNESFSSLTVFGTASCLVVVHIPHMFYMVTVYVGQVVVVDRYIYCVDTLPRTFLISRINSILKWVRGR